MPAALPFGGAPSDPTSDDGDPTSEPFLLESLLHEIRTLRARSAALVQAAAEEAQRRPSPAWERLRQEVKTAHERAERTLLAAAERDGVPPAAIQRDPATVTGVEKSGGEDAICRFRKRARELEEQCTGAVGQAGDLGLMHLSHALSQWRRELIGLEQPLIEANAQCGVSRRS